MTSVQQKVWSDVCTTKTRMSLKSLLNPTQIFGKGKYQGQVIRQADIRDLRKGDNRVAVWKTKGLVNHLTAL